MDLIQIPKQKDVMVEFQPLNKTYVRAKWYNSSEMLPFTFYTCLFRTQPIFCLIRKEASLNQQKPIMICDQLDSPALSDSEIKSTNPNKTFFPQNYHILIIIHMHLLLSVSPFIVLEKFNILYTLTPSLTKKPMKTAFETYLLSRN